MRSQSNDVCVSTEKLGSNHARARRIIMSSEAIVILVIVAFAIAGLFYLERNSRKNRGNSDE